MAGKGKKVCRLGVPSTLLCCSAMLAAAQAGPGSADGSFRLKLPVNEVVLTFHAADAEGLPVNDLKQNEIRLLDNGVSPRRIVAFDLLAGRALRAGILLDTSESMRLASSQSKAIAALFAQRVFRQNADRAFVTDFGFSSEVAQPWTADAVLIARGIRNARQGAMNPLPGTAILDAVFQACDSQFAQADPAATGNLILLFSDGDETAGHTSMEEALKACQRSNTVIDAFRPPSGAGYSTGPKLLAELAGKTGGRVFMMDDSPDAIDSDLKTIESEARNQYRLVYAPEGLKPDGSFHRIELQLPDRVKRFEVRAGYYAPRQ